MPQGRETRLCDLWARLGGPGAAASCESTSQAAAGAWPPAGASRRQPPLPLRAPARRAPAAAAVAVAGLDQRRQALELAHRGGRELWQQPHHHVPEPEAQRQPLLPAVLLQPVVAAVHQARDPGAAAGGGAGGGHLRLVLQPALLVPACGQCGGVWWCVVWCGGVWCGAVRCGAVWCGVVWCGVVWCGVVWCGVVRCGGVWWCVVVCGGVWWCVVCGGCGVVWWWCGVWWWRRRRWRWGGVDVGWGGVGAASRLRLRAGLPRALRAGAGRSRVPAARAGGLCCRAPGAAGRRVAAINPGVADAAVDAIVCRGGSRQV